MRTLLYVLLLTFVPSIAVAHTGDDIAGGAISGFLHPIKGFDHLIAMVAVGLWGAQLGRPLMIVLPIAFPMMMAFGGVLGIIGVPMIAVELGIALSGLVLGLAILAAFKAPTWLAVVLVAAFAIFHGYAHGTELPQAAAPLAYCVGFVVSTGILHLLGIALGLLNTREAYGPVLVRAGGAVVALIGAWFTLGALSLT